ncbi:MAG: DUF3221 domain-containing protein [Lachnospiraceae bacterium]|nr:DUF3221 domain-containing protein [Eubacterium sp.]MCI9595603.1 DUF3221 domain-containing protein [Lachnospiraceae bacterium]
MNRNRKTVGFVMILLCYSLAIAGLFYFFGYRAAYKHMENSGSAQNSQTFYAAISEIQNNRFTVTGLEVNDINFRGRFCFSIAEGTKITWQNTDISQDDLNIGDTVSITFTGEILETDPGQIQQVETVQLLEDEK